MVVSGPGELLEMAMEMSILKVGALATILVVCRLGLQAFFVM